MKKIVLGGDALITGKDAMTYLSSVTYKKAFLVTGGSSMIRNGVIDRCKELLSMADCDTYVYSGINKNPSIQEVEAGVAAMNEYRPDLVLAVGGGSAMDAAKAMLLFYEFPDINFDNVLALNKDGKIPTERKTGLICIGSTSGTGSEVTRGTVITDTDKKLKVPIMTDCLRPDIAILDPAVVMTMPANVVAETGMDALTHAIEAYTNHNLDDIDAALCVGAIEGIMEWLPVSCESGSEESREKVHNYQAMAGIAFANVGLGMVHGIAHSFGAVFDMAHGLTNAIILPYVLKYNSRDGVVLEKLKKLSYICHTDDIVEAIDCMRARLNIPKSFRDAGITEDEYRREFDLLLDHSMLGATNVNPVKMDVESMKKMLDLVYYGKEIDF